MTLKKETTFDLSGCCVLRDIFGFHAECKSYRVKRFLQANSPVSMGSPSVCDIGLRSVTYDDCVAKSDFLKHSTAADFNKTAEIIEQMDQLNVTEYSIFLLIKDQLQKGMN